MCGRAAVFRIAASELMICSKAAICMYVSRKLRRLRREIGQLFTRVESATHRTCLLQESETATTGKQIKVQLFRMESEFSLFIDFPE